MNPGDCWTSRESKELVASLASEIAGREFFLTNLVQGKYTAISNYHDGALRFAVARRWNSWYPSYFDVRGGCYAIIPGDASAAQSDGNELHGVIVIDPGFGSIDILRTNYQIEPQDITTIIVTHFHPDHMAGLLELATIKNTSHSPCSILLNSTLYQTFRDLHTEFIAVHEIQEHQIHKILSYTARDGMQVSVRVKSVGVHHDEIGNHHKSLGLIIETFIAPTREGMGKPFLYKLGIIGDTDGSADYITDYVRDFSEADALVLHLGTFKRTPIGDGGKHLYIDGVVRFLREFEGSAAKKETPSGDTMLSKKTLVLLSEFGLELAQDEQLYGKLLPTIISLSWRTLLIYAKLSRDSQYISEEEEKAHQIAAGFFAKATVDALARIGSDKTRSHYTRRSIEEWLVALAVVDYRREDSIVHETQQLVTALDEIIDKARHENFADGPSLNEYVQLVQNTAPTFLHRIESEFEDLLATAHARFGYVNESDAFKGCDCLMHEAIYNIENPDTSALYRKETEYVEKYAVSQGLISESEQEPSSNVVGWRWVKSLVSALAFRNDLEKDKKQGKASPVERGCNRLQIGKLFQEVSASWSQLLIADIGLTLGICPIELGQESGESRKRGVWLRTSSGRWVNPSKSEAFWNQQEECISYRGEED